MGKVFLLEVSCYKNSTVCVFECVMWKCAGGVRCFEEENQMPKKRVDFYSQKSTQKIKVPKY